MKVNISPIKAFKDNYIWAISTKHSNKIALVDPGQAAPCIQYLKDNNVQLAAILITHHHADHVGGIKELLESPYCSDEKPLVFGPANENIPCCDIKLDQDDSITLDFLSLTFNIIALPGHTLGHIAYYNEHQQILFCGDTLFSGGCGRLFEGSPAQMHHSLEKLAALPEQTQVYCTHEYTQANLNFALAVEPNNTNLVNYFNQVNQLRANDQASLPSSIGLEKAINPFLRCHSSEVIDSAKQYDEQALISSTDVFRAIRQWKDNF